jgi:hypothetical protein
MQITPPGQEQSAARVIHVTGVSYISKGETSTMWHVSVPICGQHGLAALQNPATSLIRLLKHHKCCGKCCTAMRVQEDGSSRNTSGDAQPSSGSNAPQVDTGCSCGSCSVQMAFKFPVPFQQLKVTNMVEYHIPYSMMELPVHTPLK